MDKSWQKDGEEHQGLLNLSMEGKNCSSRQRLEYVK